MWNKIKNWFKEKWRQIIALLLGGICLAAINEATINDVSQVKLTEKYEMAQEIKVRYQQDGSSLKMIAKDDPKDMLRVQIGDKDADNFVPSMMLSRWDEVSLKIKPRLQGIAIRDRRLDFAGNKIIFSTPKMSYEMYEDSEGEGGYKFVWYLNKKPTTNKITFDISTEGLDFFYQPPLTQEYQNGYSEEFGREIVVSETQVKDLEGNVLVERPENVVGSYAVYHSTKGGLNDINGKDYKVGKAFHLYRPKITDSEGNWTWGIYHLDIEKGIYAVEIPQEFLDKAVYPIRSNETFGWNAQGVSTGTIENAMRSGRFAISANGTGISISAYLTCTLLAKNAKCNIYDDGDGDGDLIVNLITNGATEEIEIPIDFDTWQSFNFNTAPTFINGTSYRLTVWGVSSTGVLKIYYDSTITGAYAYYLSTTYGTWPDPITFSATLAESRYSIYATYTPAGNGVVAPYIDRSTIIEEE